MGSVLKTIASVKNGTNFVYLHAKFGGGSVYTRWRENEKSFHHAGLGLISSRRPTAIFSKLMNDIFALYQLIFKRFGVFLEYEICFQTACTVCCFEVNC